MKKTEIRILAVAVALTLLFTSGLPTIAAQPGDITEQKTYPNGNSFHCGQAGGNGRVEVEVDGVIYGGGPVTFVYAGMYKDEKDKDFSVWKLDHDEFYCTECGSNDWVAYSNKTDELKGGNPQIYHPGGTPPEIEPDTELGELTIIKKVKVDDVDLDELDLDELDEIEFPLVFEFTVSDGCDYEQTIIVKVDENNNSTMLVNGVSASYLELPVGDYTVVEDVEGAEIDKYNLTVTNDAEDGDREATAIIAFIEDGDEVTVIFTNAYEADEDEKIPEDPDPVTVDFYKRTLVNGARGTLRAGDFEFNLFKDGEEDPTDESYNDADGLVSFTFTKDDIGKYVIKENVPARWTLTTYRQGLSFEVILSDQNDDAFLEVIFDDEITELELSFELDCRVFVNSRSTGGDDGGGDDGGDTGGGGGVPQISERPDAADITTPDVPLAPAPVEPETETIIEEEVPLGDLPQTGDSGFMPLLTMMLISASFTGIFITLRTAPGIRKSKYR